MAKIGADVEYIALKEPYLLRKGQLIFEPRRLKLANTSVFFNKRDSFRVSIKSFKNCTFLIWEKNQNFFTESSWDLKIGTQSIYTVI